MSEKEKNQLSIGSKLFFFCWIISILLLPASFYFKLISITNKTVYPAILIQIGLILTPFLKSFSVGSIFKVELKELSKSVDDLKTSFQSFISVNQNNVQVMKNYNIQTPVGDFEVETIKLSNKYLKLGYSLYHQKRYIESLEYYKKAFDLDSNNWVASLLLGSIYLSLNDFKVPQSSWGFNDEERLAKSIFYLTLTIRNDPNHYNQYMNLGLAYLKLNGDNSLKLAYSNLETAYTMLCDDQNIQLMPSFMLDKGKSLSFMGEAAKKLNLIEKAIEHRKESINIFDNCPKPTPLDLNKWRDLSQNALLELEKKA
ncbi:MAG: tetratricopeptide repeat protein [Candidatus Tenebribacter davisii]|nr:tetratricopeptide repeat protein [Candidatus Tenebribacter davisii]